MKIILLTTLILNFTVFAQITITSTDIASQYIFGNSIVIHESENPSTADIGFQGGGNLWDFSTLTGEIQGSLTCVNPASTPYNSDFLVLQLPHIHSGCMQVRWVKFGSMQPLVLDWIT
ncbi:MAG: hypothetical protein IPJ23_11070 [Ignavibacteriales bacterium]|nr:hypothetical protein [Ignavibacteriales bacterium]